MSMRGIKILVCALLLNCFLVVNCLGGDGLGVGGIGADGITNPMIGSPTGSLTEPVTSYDPTAFTVPRPGIASGNMMITGNVGGGKHFRGYLPYGSATDIQANLESTSMDSFLRYSSGSYQPFYSPTGSSISVTGPAAVGIIRPVSEKVRGYGGMDEYFTPFSSSMATQPVASLPISEYGTIPVTGYGYGQSLLGQVQGYGAPEQFLRLGSGLELVGGSEQSLAGGQGMEISLLKSNIESTLVSDKLKPFEIGKTGEQLEVSEQIDVYEQMKGHFGVLEDISAEQVGLAQVNERIRKTVEEQWKAKVEIARVGMAKVIERRRERQKTQQARGGGIVPKEVRQARTATTKKYKTFASESGDEFNHYIEAAEQYLKEGKYYQAADAYSLASIYKPLDPLSYAGKSHALFAAGEYLSSARLLAFALKIFPDYALVKVDLVEMFGDERLIEMRMAELAKWASESNSGELQLLLAYICYQMDKQVLAKTAIGEAYKRKPGDDAVLALKKVIDELRGGQ